MGGIEVITIPAVGSARDHIMGTAIAQVVSKSPSRLKTNFKRIPEIITALHHTISGSDVKVASE